MKKVMWYIKKQNFMLNGLRIKESVVTWTEGWWIFGKTYTWNQAQYLGGTVGRYVYFNLYVI